MKNYIPVTEPDIGKKELEYVTQAVSSGWVSSKGEFIKRFEKEFAAYCGVKYGVATNTGTAALHLALTALGIGEGDEVIVPALTYIATADAVRYTGAKPVFVDVDEYHWGIDKRLVGEVLTRKIKAIIPVHLYGHSVSFSGVKRIDKDSGDIVPVLVIEDCAEAHGAEFKGTRVGSLGNVGCFSFYGNKIMTTGEGGMCVTNDEELANKMRHLRNAAMVKPYQHDQVGFNYQMTNMQAALGCAQLERLDEFIEKKRLIASWYVEGLQDLANQGKITLHPEAGWAKCVYWLYSVLIKSAFGMSRDMLARQLEEEGIETRPFFGVIPYMPHYKDGKRYPMAERLSNEGINLPSSVNLKREEVDYVCEKIRRLI